MGVPPPGLSTSPEFLLTKTSFYKVDNHVTNIVLCCIFCTSVRTEPVSKSAISFLKLNVKCTYPETVHSKLLYNSQFNVLYNLIDSPEKLDSHFITEVARGYLVNKIAH